MVEEARRSSRTSRVRIFFVMRLSEAEIEAARGRVKRWREADGSGAREGRKESWRSFF